MQEALSVETRSGIRSLDTTELDSVSGGNPIIGGLLVLGFLAGFDLGVSGAAEELVKPVLEVKGGKVLFAGQPIK